MDPTEDVYTALFETHKETFLKVARKTLPPGMKDQAEDIVHDTYISLRSWFPTLRDQKQFKSTFCLAVQQNCFRHVRRERRREVSSEGVDHLVSPDAMTQLLRNDALEAMTEAYTAFWKPTEQQYMRLLMEVVRDSEREMSTAEVNAHVCSQMGISVGYGNNIRSSARSSIEWMHTGSWKRFATRWFLAAQATSLHPLMDLWKIAETPIEKALVDRWKFRMAIFVGYEMAIHLRPAARNERCFVLAGGDPSQMHSLTDEEISTFCYEYQKQRMAECLKNKDDEPLQHFLAEWAAAQDLILEEAEELGFRSGTLLKGGSPELAAVLEVLKQRAFANILLEHRYNVERMMRVMEIVY